MWSSGVAASQELTAVDPPAKVLVRPEGGEQLRGWVTQHDSLGFTLLDPAERNHRVLWTSLPPARELWVHEQFLGRDDAEGWYRLTARLMKRDDGQRAANDAASRLLRIEPTLAEKIDRLRAGEEVPYRDPPEEESEGDSATGSEPETSDPPGHAEGGGAGGPVQTGETETQFWGDLSDEVMAQSVAELRAEAQQAQRNLGTRLREYDDDHFMVFSDIDPAEARRWVGLLDDMYDRLMEMFQLPQGKNIFRGKCLVYIFENPQDYYRYCMTELQFDGRATAGVCESRGNGLTVVAFYRQPNTLNFAHVLVHEAVHAFVHRYRSYPFIPSWINEGIAEYVAHNLVDNRGFGQSDWSKNADARTELQRRGNSLQGMLDAPSINGWQYPVAHELCQFMVRQSSQRYRAFIDAIKDGKPWEVALEEDYGLTRVQLVDAFGQSIRIRRLQP